MEQYISIDLAVYLLGYDQLNASASELSDVLPPDLQLEPRKPYLPGVKCYSIPHFRKLVQAFEWRNASNAAWRRSVGEDRRKELERLGVSLNPDHPRSVTSDGEQST